MGEWGDWGSCSLTCGLGTRWRSREVTVRALGYGPPCPTLHLSQGCLGRTTCPRTDVGPSNEGQGNIPRDRQPLPAMVVTRGPDNQNRERVSTARPLVDFVIVPQKTESDSRNPRPSPRYREVVDKSSASTNNRANGFHRQGTFTGRRREMGKANYIQYITYISTPIVYPHAYS